MKHNAKHRGHHGDKKNRTSPHAASANPAWERIKERFRRIDRGDILRTAGWLLLFSALYALLNHFRFTFHWVLYPVVLGLLAVAYLLLNGGSFDRHTTLTVDDLPDDWDRARKEKAVSDFNARKAWAKRLLPPLIGIMLTLMFDLIYLNVVTL